MTQVFTFSRTLLGHPAELFLDEKEGIIIHGRILSVVSFRL